MSEGNVVNRKASFMLGVVCIILSVSLAGAVIGYISLASQVTELQKQVMELQKQVNVLNSNCAKLSALNEWFEWLKKQYGFGDVNASETASAPLNIQVVSVDIVKIPYTITLVSATIKNTGNKPITSCTVTVFVDGGQVQLSLGAMEPGQTKSASTTTLPSGASVTVGKTYHVKIDATATDGSTLSKSLTVTCTG